MRNSKYKTDILEFERGKFLYTANDTIIQMPKFSANGKPYEFKVTAQPKPYYTIEETEPTLLDRIKAILK